MEHGRDMGRDFGITGEAPALSQLNERSREIFKRIVEGYLDSGEPVGSRNVSRTLPMSLSPASVRNVMTDLEMLGLIYAPHMSAGRMPTELGLRFFVDAMLEVGDLGMEDRAQIEAEVRATDQSRSMDDILKQASSMLSGLSRGAAVVLASKTSKKLKHIEFVRLEPTQALVVMVADDGSVENRVLTLPPGLPASVLTEASNFLNARLKGRTLDAVRAELETRRADVQKELDELTAKLVDAGLATWAGIDGNQPQLIVRGQANLLGDLRAAEDLERIRLLFADLETQKDVIDLLGRAEKADGVRIYIGSENKLFSLSGSSMVAAPLRGGNQQIIGVIGVIGPTRLNYARIVPMVDYTAKVVSTVLNSPSRTTP
jgi:heat-inducible transcriptional repressor